MIQWCGIKPVTCPIKQNPLLPVQYKTRSSSISGSRERKQLSVRAAESVPWEERIPPNSVRLSRCPLWFSGTSLGVDLVSPLKCVTIGDGSAFRILAVKRCQGAKLEKWLLDLAEKEDAHESVIGLSKDTEQSNRIRSVAVSLAAAAAERGRRVYLLDQRILAEDKSILDSSETDYSYTAIKILDRYYKRPGEGIELIVPEGKQLQDKIRKGRPTVLDYF